MNVTVQTGRQRRGTFVSPLAHVVRTVIHGEPIFFTVGNPFDAIQRCHMEGRFYEQEELAIIARHFPIGGTFLDVGANVANHTVYVAKFLHASRIVCIEPNPPAIALLESNVWLNGLAKVVDGSFLGVGLSDQRKENVGFRYSGRNLGGARAVEGEGSIRLERADTLLAGQRFDFIKIDVEGMELAVLSGMSAMLATHRPKMFIEVDNGNAQGFAAWLEGSGYRVVEQFRRYSANINYLVAPVP